MNEDVESWRAWIRTVFAEEVADLPDYYPLFFLCQRLSDQWDAREDEIQRLKKEIQLARVGGPLRESTGVTTAGENEVAPPTVVPNQITNEVT